MELIERLLSKKLLLVTGKGGIGKSLIAASLGLEAAKRGRTVCVVEMAADDQLAPLYGHAPVGHSLTRMRDNLYIINLRPQDNFRDFIVMHLGHAKLFEKVFTRGIVRSFIEMIPGIAELTLLGRLFYFCELSKTPQFDLVIFDGSASGHFHSLMTTPDAILRSGLVGPIVYETSRVKEYLADARTTGIVLATTAEELVVSEAIEFAEKFRREAPAKIAAVMVNRYQPPVEAPSVAAALKAADPALAPALDFIMSRGQDQAAQIKVLREGLQATFPPEERPGLLLLPDQGAIDEPLTADGVGRWWRSAREEVL